MTRGLSLKLSDFVFNVCSYLRLAEKMKLAYTPNDPLKTTLRCKSRLNMQQRLCVKTNEGTRHQQLLCGIVMNAMAATDRRGMRFAWCTLGGEMAHLILQPRSSQWPRIASMISSQGRTNRKHSG